jgi:uncharacterized protein (DUF2147 family)
MRAKTVTVLAALAAFLALAGGGTSVSADLTPAGLWQSVDQQTKQPNGWFLIVDHDGVYDGVLAKMFLQPGQDPNVVCSRCTGDRHNKPWLGLEIIRGMKPAGDAGAYDGGTILDPRDGNVYDAEMKLTPDGQTLVVRGYLGISLLGRNQYWTRLPDADYAMLDPSIKALAASAGSSPGH